MSQGAKHSTMVRTAADDWQNAGVEGQQPLRPLCSSPPSTEDLCVGDIGALPLWVCTAPTVGRQASTVDMHSTDKTCCGIQHILQLVSGGLCCTSQLCKAEIRGKSLCYEIRSLSLGICGIDFFYFGSVSVRFLRKFTVICYLCNIWIVNL